MMERDVALVNITCSYEYGGTEATELLNGVYRLTSRGINGTWELSCLLCH